MLTTIPKTKAQLVGKKMQFYPPPANCVLYYPGYPPNGSTIIDQSGSANTGTITGATWTRLGSGLWGLDFNGATGEIDLGTSTTLDLNTTAAWEVWANADDFAGAAGNYNCIAGKATSWLLAVRTVSATNGYLYWAGHDTLGAWHDSVRSESVVGEVIAGTWQHLVAIFEEGVVGTAKILINGVDVTAASSDDPGRQTSAGSAYIARNIINSRWDGKLALPRFYNVCPSVGFFLNHFQREKHLFNI